MSLVLLLVGMQRLAKTSPRQSSFLLCLEQHFALRLSEWVDVTGYIPSNGVRLMCGVRLMVNKTNSFNAEFVLKIPPTVIYQSFHVYLSDTQLPM